MAEGRAGPSGVGGRAPTWQDDERGIEFLVARGRLEHVTASPANARFLIGEARRHLASGAALASTDVSLAFLAVYDAARKSLAAILAVQGLRATGGDGGHAVLLDAVRPQFPDHRPVLQEFDWMRQTRNATEHPDFESPTATHADVLEALPAATAIVDPAHGFVGSRPG